MEVISINDRSKKKLKNDLLEVLDHLRTQVENGLIEEFVVSSMTADGDVEIHASIKDLIGGVGLFEIGKNILISQHTLADLHD